MAAESLELAHELGGRIAVGGRPGAEIREARKRCGFTQAWLAGHLGVRRESLSRIESGHATPTLEVVSRFARIMALAQQVRTYAATLEKSGGTPSHHYFRTLGQGLGLETETVDEVAHAALGSYGEKRRALLEDLRKRGTA